MENTIFDSLPGDMLAWPQEWDELSPVSDFMQEEQADLYLSNYSAKVDSDGDTTVKFRVGNRGKGVSGATTVSIYSGSLLIDTIAVSALPPKEKTAFTYTIPAGTFPAGTHTLTVFVDDGNQVMESNENNNSKQKKIKIRSDIQLVSLSVPADATTDDEITVSFTVINQCAAIGATEAYIYDGGKKIGSVDVKALEIGESATYYFTIDADSLSAKKHKIKVALDGAKDVAESNEKNNWKTESVKITRLAADLSVVDMQLPREAVEDEEVDLQFTVINEGTKAACATEAYIYDGGRKIGAVDVAALEIGESATYHFAIEADSLSATKHKIKVVLDAEQEIWELSEKNNTETESIKIERAAADLEIDDMSLPSRATDDEKVELQFTVINDGTHAACATEAHIYDGLEKIGSVDIAPLEIGESATYTYIIDTDELYLGKHKIKVVLDAEQEIWELSEKNNTETESIKIERAAADLVIDDMSLPSEATDDEKVKLKFTVTNEGTDAACATEAYIYDGIIKIGEVKVAALEIGESATYTYIIDTDDLYIGKHKIKVVLDAGLDIWELDEKNNTDTESIKIGKEDPWYWPFSSSEPLTLPVAGCATDRIPGVSTQETPLYLLA